METIGGHGRWSSDEGPKFLSNLALIHKSCPMGGGGVVEVVEVVEVYLQNQYTKTRKMGPWGIKNYNFDNTSFSGDVLWTNFKINRARPSYVFLNPYPCRNLLARWDLGGLKTTMVLKFQKLTP